MDETITRGDAEKVPQEDISKATAWYIPHHGVYHLQKPGKMCVVFDCSARFKETCLNDHLLTGPELTNTVVGVLCRFRRGPVAIMCDIERMFHQFHVKAEDQDYLRFLWWENGNLEAEPSIYRMKVHLFGATSSPGCANFGLKRLAAEGRGHFSEDTIRFILRNFYVDDGFASVTSERQAIQLVKEARELCSTGKLRLHKFISTSKEVLATIPKEECAKAAKDLDMALGEQHMDRALGVQWCVSSDQFQFRVLVKENPFTRRGVLSTVASVYDPLGFVAPFILIGKQILQQMCRDKLSWDDPLPDDLRPLWEYWLKDLKNLAGVKIQRCYTDHASRGLTAEQLVASNWFTGPDFLWQKELPSGYVKVGDISISDPELKKVQVHDTQAKGVRSLLDRLHKFSDWLRVVKAIARLKRCAKEVKGLKLKSCEASSLEESREAEMTIIKMFQHATLSQEFQCLQHHKEIGLKSKLNKLHSWITKESSEWEAA
ncbi:hypothetical protein N1851_027293 [Merluccius polli]|uniref:Reverse transcriptase domain-containing protein n=1 Tax=Merluccius polli TaxID=89951 RepID=A0AA47MAA0_MERPO|nr:hypothetical protein N1851_027293 [Merluccius polli]